MHFHIELLDVALQGILNDNNVHMRAFVRVGVLCQVLHSETWRAKGELNGSKFHLFFKEEIKNEPREWLETRIVRKISPSIVCK